MASILLLMYYGKKYAYSIPHLALRVEQNILKTRLSKQKPENLYFTNKNTPVVLRKNYG